MTDDNGIRITTRDRVLRAWLNSTELVRDYRAYAQEIEDDNSIADLFNEYAEDEAYRASTLLEILHELESQ